MASYLLHSKLAGSRHLLTAIIAAQHRQQSMQHLQQESKASKEDMSKMILSRSNMNKIRLFWKSWNRMVVSCKVLQMKLLGLLIAISALATCHRLLHIMP